MPLKSGAGSIRSNVKELNTGKVGSARKKAIATYARNHNVSTKEARFQLSLIIAKSKANEKA